GPRAPRAAAGLGRDHALGVAPVVLDLVEAQAAHGVLHVELVLEPEGYCLRIAYQQEVVGHLFRIGRSGPRAVAGQEGHLGFPRAVAVVARELAEEALILFPGLGPPEVEQRGEGLPQRLDVRRAGEDHPPARLLQLARIEPLLQSPPRLA